MYDCVVQHQKEQQISKYLYCGGAAQHYNIIIACSSRPEYMFYTVIQCNVHNCILSSYRYNVWVQLFNMYTWELIAKCTHVLRCCMQ